MRNGATVLLETLREDGVDLCFMNPGTSEMHLVEAIGHTSIRPVLALFEGVCTGAADGYARMTGRPALVLLHLGPGLANGLAHIHNARRGQVPMVTLVGNHARALLPLDPPLSLDIAAIARGVAAQYVVLNDPETIVKQARLALAAATARPSRPVVLDMPADCAWAPADDQVPYRPETADEVNLEAVDRAARGLRDAGGRGALLIGHTVCDDTLAMLETIAAAYGTRLLCETFAPRHARGAGRVPIERMAYFPADVLNQLASLDYLLLAGSKRPTAFFAYPGAPLDLVPSHVRVKTLCHWGTPAAGSLRALAEAARTVGDAPPLARQHRATAAVADAPLDSATLAATVAHWLPDDMIVVDESITNSPALYAATAGAAPHDWLSLCGGALGYGMPAAVGAALACPDRQVLCLVGDGSANYSVQALWTMARERLPIAVVVLASSAYRILELEYAAMTKASPHEPATRPLMQLADPSLDWVAIARGYGVDAISVQTTDQLRGALERLGATPGPLLIEAHIR